MIGSDCVIHYGVVLPLGEDDGIGEGVGDTLVLPLGDGVVVLDVLPVVLLLLDDGEVDGEGVPLIVPLALSVVEAGCVVVFVFKILVEVENPLLPIDPTQSVNFPQATPNSPFWIAPTTPTLLSIRA